MVRLPPWSPGRLLSAPIRPGMSSASMSAYGAYTYAHKRSAHTRHRTDRAGVLLQCHNIATRSRWPAHAAYRRLSAILPRIVLVCLVQAQVGTKFVDCTALYVGKLYILLLPGPVVMHGLIYPPRRWLLHTPRDASFSVQGHASIRNGWARKTARR